MKHVRFETEKDKQVKEETTTKRQNFNFLGQFLILLFSLSFN